MVKERQDITGLNCIKGASGKVIVDDKGIKDSWKEYMEKLINEENEWDHKISAEVKEGPADRTRMDEVRAALKKMKRHRAPGLSGLVGEMIQATGYIGTQWVLDLRNGIVKRRKHPRRLEIKCGTANLQRQWQPYGCLLYTSPSPRD